MLTFSPPSGYHDVSEYTFAGDGRRVVVRHTHGLGSANDLLQVAQDYSVQLKDYLNAEEVAVSDIKQRPDGAEYVTAVAHIEEGSIPTLERSAFMRFGNGTSVQLSLTAKAEDEGAAAEFEKLIASVQPVAPPAVGERALPQSATNEFQIGRHAGAVTVNLAPAYQDMTVLKFRNPEGTQQLSVKVDAPSPAAVPQSAATGAATVASANPLSTAAPAAKPTSLFGPTATTQDDRGRTFAYETDQHLWKSPANRARAQAMAAGAFPPAAPPPERTATEVIEIGGKRVTVHVRSTEATAGSAELVSSVTKSIKSK